MKTLRRLLFVSRPVSWPNTAFPFAATYLYFNGQIDFLFVIGTLFFLIPYNIIMYGINDVFDYASDIKNPRKNSIEGALESRNFHPTIIAGAVISALPFLILMYLSSNGLQALILSAVLFFAIAYSALGLRFKEIPVLDSITSSLHFVGPMIYALSFFTFDMTSALFACAFFLWGMASHALGAVQDIIPDRQGGIHSVATFFGARRTLWGSIVLYTIAAGIVALQPQGMSVAFAGLAYAVNALQFYNVTDRTSERVNIAWRRFIYLNYATGAVISIQLCWLWYIAQ